VIDQTMETKVKEEKGSAEAEIVTSYTEDMDDGEDGTLSPDHADSGEEGNGNSCVFIRMSKKLPISNKRRAMHESMAKKLRPGNPFREILQDHVLHQQIILNMALQREPCTKEQPLQPVSNVIREGFYWRDYPVLEEMLYDNMEEYYQISSVNRQSKFQQMFNNQLVERIRKEASEQGWEFEEAFTIKKLRDRVRCFFKTHLQNAKKRLATLLKHPESVSHQSLLQQFWPKGRKMNISAYAE
jgi:hypothetical protein